jgi:hypothetical protein
VRSYNDSGFFYIHYWFEEKERNTTDNEGAEDHAVTEITLHAQKSS